MATTDSISTDCASMPLEQHQLDVEVWARQIVRDTKPSKRGVVPCPPFPVLAEPPRPRGRTTTASGETSHD